jgi:hypothetical protein
VTSTQVGPRLMSPLRESFQPLIEEGESLSIATLSFSLHLLLAMLSISREEGDALILGLLHFGLIFLGFANRALL